MNLVDDLNRNITADDYENVINSFITHFSNPHLTFYLYGSNEPPRSDLDFLILIHSTFPWKKLKKLYQEICLFIQSDALRRYFFSHPVSFCPAELFGQTSNYLSKFKPDSLRLLSGRPADLESPDFSREAEEIFLLGRILNDIDNLRGFLKGEKKSLRSFLSRLHKIRRLTFIQMKELCPDTDFSDLAERIRDWNERARQPSFELQAHHHKDIEDLARKIDRFIREYCDLRCLPFLRSVFNIPEQMPKDPESLILTAVPLRSNLVFVT